MVVWANKILPRLDGWPDRLVRYMKLQGKTASTIVEEWAVGTDTVSETVNCPSVRAWGWALNQKSFVDHHTISALADIRLKSRTLYMVAMIQVEEDSYAKFIVKKTNTVA